MAGVNQFQSIQPRDEKGRFQSPRKVGSNGNRIVQLSEFEARMLGNRLYELGDYHEENSTHQMAGECKWWANKITDECETRSEYTLSQSKKRHLDATYTIWIELSEFEAKWLGDRLWEMGDRYHSINENNIAQECKWWARRFHAESGEC